jgi:pyruvate-formate lyase-activating enzyme
MNLRLLVTYDCPRSCAKCCNKAGRGPTPAICDPSKLDQYAKILITGGEPLLYPDKLISLIMYLRSMTEAKIIVYTAMSANHDLLERIIHEADGMTLTLHDPADAQWFYGFSKQRKLPRGKLLRLNIFEGVRPLVPKGWKIQPNMVWMDECKLPKGEVFERLGTPWHKAKEAICPLDIR